MGGHIQQRRAGLRYGLGRGTEPETDRLAGVTIQQEKGLCHFAGFVLGAEAVATHLALAVAGHSVRVQRQQRALKMLAGSAQFAQGDLQSLGLLKGMGFQQVVDSQVSGDKGQAVG